MFSIQNNHYFPQLVLCVEPMSIDRLIGKVRVSVRVSVFADNHIDTDRLIAKVSN